MPRDIVEPTENERGDEQHPAFGMIGFSRGQGTPRVLFDSETKHTQSISLRISTATRKRDLSRDWIHSDKQIIEVEMSMAQFAAFVASGGGGEVPCTIRYRPVESERWIIPNLPYAPRLALSVEEVRTAAERAVSKVREAFNTYKERRVVGNLRALETAIEHLPANAEFAAKSLNEHVENVAAKMRADVEAMVTDAAARHGIDAGELRERLLEAGEVG